MQSTPIQQEFDRLQREYFAKKDRINELVPRYDAAEGAELSRVRAELGKATDEMYRAERAMLSFLDAHEAEIE